MRTHRGIPGLMLVALLSVPGVSAAAVEALFDLSSPDRSPFPSNRFTELDFSNLTNLQVRLPEPDCAVQVSECQDLEVINTLDGFNLQPRLSVPFSGPIDVSTVDSSNVFLVRLGDVTDLRDRLHSHRRPQRIGINQIVFDPDSNTLHVESDELLEQHTRYALIVTNDVRDTRGKRVKAGDFAKFRNPGRAPGADPRLLLYRLELWEALAAAGVPPGKVVAASVFTTQSATAVLEKVRDQIKSAVPAPADFVLGDGGERTVFALNDIAGITFNRQVGTAPAFRADAVPVAALHIFPGAVGTVAFGRYRSPDYLNEARFIPAVGTRLGAPQVQRTEDVHFTLVLPAGPAPAGGWPVVVFGHGFGGERHTLMAVAATMAAHGLATVGINVVGHGGGPLGEFVVDRVAGADVTLAAGGRGIDQDGDGDIESTEGVNAGPTIISNRDGLRQTVIDIMQLVRVIETGGMDVDGDGASDLSRSRIYYSGISFGGIYGTMALAVEPAFRAGVPNVPGGPIIDIARLSPVFRPLVTQILATRNPPLLNVAGPPAPPLFGFDENIPLRNRAPLVNAVAGAMPIQSLIERTEWVSQSGNPVAYARHVRREPLAGNAPKPVIYQFAKGDRTVPNPTTTNILRAGDLADVTTYFRNDLVVAAIPGAPTDPHPFLANIANPAVATLALAAQAQIATFFATDGALIVDPDGPGPFFETPIEGELPEELNFIEPF